MRTAVRFAIVAVAFQCAFLPSALCGTWRDHFHQGLSPEWKGDTADFHPTNEVLEGVSASPLASRLNILEIVADSTDCVVGCWINVVAPNLHVCTKGALILRHSGTNGYVFALHEATQTIEVYRLPTREMLLLKSARIDLKKWYYLSAELRGPVMRFFVDGELIGTVTDSVASSGAVGVAVQDAEPVLFDDFSVSGPNVIGNVDAVSTPAVSLIELTAQEIKFSFEALPPYDYYVQVSSAPTGHAWQTITNFTAKIESFEAVFSDTLTNGLRFYRIEKVPCGCR